MSSYPQTVNCGTCREPARLVILHAPQCVVDNVDRAGFDVGAGAYFSNKSEKRAWMKTAGLDGGPVEEICSEDVSKAKERLTEKREILMEKQPESRAQVKASIEHEKQIQRGKAVAV